MTRQEIEWEKETKQQEADRVEQEAKSIAFNEWRRDVQVIREMDSVRTSRCSAKTKAAIEEATKTLTSLKKKANAERINKEREILAEYDLECNKIKQ